MARRAECPTCGEPLEATAIIYLSDVVLNEVDPEEFEVVDYEIAHHLGDRSDGVVLAEQLHVYCRNDHTIVEY